MLRCNDNSMHYYAKVKCNTCDAPAVVLLPHTPMLCQHVLDGQRVGLRVAVHVNANAGEEGRLVCCCLCSIAVELLLQFVLL
jgi:hypothetical protein